SHRGKRHQRAAAVRSARKPVAEHQRAGPARRVRDTDTVLGSWRVQGFEDLRVRGSTGSTVQVQGRVNATYRHCVIASPEPAEPENPSNPWNPSNPSNLQN